jgi:histidyl-tRNA synthetase
LSKIIEPLRGVHDVLPAQIAAWQHLERITREVFAGYGYEEFRVPVIEQTQLFKRSIGDFTDIVEKEMFSFVDQGEDHITLRPEATAGIVRAVISNGMLREGRLRVWCMGPMFRRERPQAGRYRQFHQIDAEAFGFAGPDVDAEIILLSARLLRRLGLTRLKLLVNSLGTPASRAVYREQLTAYFSAHESSLDEDSKRRLKGNPLRILDSTNPDM